MGSHAMRRSYRGRNVNGAINSLKVQGRSWLVLEWGNVDHLSGVGFQQEGVDADFSDPLKI
jgi:hypothetical protein